MPTYESHVTISPVFYKPAKLSYPFAAQGDSATIVVEQPLVQLADRYTPAVLSSAFSTGLANLSGSPVTIGTAYCVGDVGHSETDAGLISFTRKWSMLPVPQRTFTTATSTRPYFSVYANGKQSRFFRTVSTMIYDQFFLVNRALPYGTLPTISSITRSGATATVTTASAHGLTTNDLVQVTGATYTTPLPIGTDKNKEYNIEANITVTGATTFTYPVSGSPTSPATGTITIKKVGVGSVYSDPSFIRVINPDSYVTIDVLTSEFTEFDIPGPIIVEDYKYMLEPSNVSNYMGDIYMRTVRLIQGP